jgi:hypothetical protein
MRDIAMLARSRVIHAKSMLIGDTVIMALGPGQFTGEANMLSGHRLSHDWCGAEHTLA